MDPITQQTVLAAAGAAGGDPVYVDDVFSTFLYEGNDTDRNIVNGINLADEGGLVWIKARAATQATHHYLIDSAYTLGASKYLRSDTNAQASDGPVINTFNTNGFGLDSNWYGNTSSSQYGGDYVSWTFRKAPGFFDVVTYTGTGSTRTIAHNLGSVPGMIICKCTSHAGEGWHVYHRSLGPTKYIRLNDANAAATYSGSWNNTAPTSSVFTVGDYSEVNSSGKTYVAYIFAHDDAQFGTDGNESIIKCGSYTGTNGAHTVSCGFEPQFVMIKRTDSSADWVMIDAMRTHTEILFPNKTDYADSTSSITFASTGFGLNYNSSEFNVSGGTYIYMAIRRPNKPPEVATDVFNPAIQVGTVPNFASSFPVDFGIRLLTASGSSTYSQTFMSRLTGEGYLASSQTNQEATGSFASWDKMNGWGDFGGSGYGYSFKRAPGFMDVVAYEGNGTSSNTITHNLGVTPELMFIKNRDNATYGEWGTYYKTATAGGPTKYLVLNTSDAQISTGTPGHWRETEPTSTTFALGSDWDVNGSYSYIAYLFATLPGISKVGSYTGTGSAQNIDCGFTNGARFVLIKKTSASGDWYVYDTTRGISSGNEPFLMLNSTLAQTSANYIGPHSSGFAVTTETVLNGSGATYIFLAIA